MMLFNLIINFALINLLVVADNDFKKSLPHLLKTNLKNYVSYFGTYNVKTLLLIVASY